jgi:hypothetical protein
MITEAHKILEDMKRWRPREDDNSPDSKHLRAILDSCRLSVVVAEQQADSAAKLERFTFWLIVLTVVLVVIGGVQVALMFCGHQ